jgi:hypothetical protein
MKQPFGSKGSACLRRRQVLPPLSSVRTPLSANRQCPPWTPIFKRSRSEFDLFISSTSLAMSIEALTASTGIREYRHGPRWQDAARGRARRASIRARPSGSPARRCARHRARLAPPPPDVPIRNPSPLQARLFELGHTPIDVWIQRVDIDGDGGGHLPSRLREAPPEVAYAYRG